MLSPKGVVIGHLVHIRGCYAAVQRTGWAETQTEQQARAICAAGRWLLGIRTWC